MNNAKIREATNTKIELFWRSLYLDHVTLCTISSYDSLIYCTSLDIVQTFAVLNFARVERLELPANGFGDHYSTN